ncbi:hypothetical protein BGZ96_002222 [Linnemannia gamsii]|uniref:Fatty acid desaturase domain-containing protein n=1 Tax=Linnemannia gamsii TaxID=64522 RepID=A0ABQ7K8A6_9FUNG|nr:hypothetical protein BGZ96_002222 [Linnemannia gamsii]
MPNYIHPSLFPLHVGLIPEVLARVGHFVPLWEVRHKRHHKNTGTFLKPATMRACLLVSKIWYHTFLPILWHTYICPQMKNVPLEVVRRYSPHFRIFDSFSGHPGPFECNNLVELILPRQMYLPGASEEEPLSLKTERELVRANPGVRSLFWFGPRSQIALDPKDFVGLRVVKNVKLLHWIGSGGRLARTLKMLAGSMVSLELAWIVGLSAKEFLDPDGSFRASLDVVPTCWSLLSFQTRTSTSIGLRAISESVARRYKP